MITKNGQILRFQPINEAGPRTQYLDVRQACNDWLKKNDPHHCTNPRMFAFGRKTEAK